MRTRLPWLLLILILVAISCNKPVPIEEKPPVDPPGLAKVTTNEPTGLSVFSIILGGSIVDSGTSAVTESGIVVDTIGAPTVQRNFRQFKMKTDEKGTFSSIITNLPSEVTFFVRAYSINQSGTSYGNEVVFTSKRHHVLTGMYPPLRTQDEVNSFGAMGYTELVNGLEIVGTDITDLSPLSSIAILGGGLTIKETSLTNLKGLENLEIIGSIFYNSSEISRNPLLKNLEGLNKLKIIRGMVSIAYNPSMENLSGIPNLTQIEGGDLSISNCDRLKTVDGPDKLQLLDGDLILINNPSLTHLKGFRPLTMISGRIQISGCGALPNLDGFEGLKSLNTVQLELNASLSNVSGFKNVTNIQSLSLDSMVSLHDFSALSKVSSIGRLSIQRSPLIKDLRGFENLTSLSHLKLWFNSGLIDLKGLENIRTMQRLEISFNHALKNLTGLNSLSSVTGHSYSITVSSNPSLNSLTGLENLRHAPGQLFFENNAPDVNYCALKPFMEQYTGKGLFFDRNGTMITQDDILQNCP